MPEVEAAGALTAEESAELGDLEERMSDAHAWHQPGNQLARNRAQALYGKAETGILDDHRVGPTGRRILEIEKMMADRDGEYWHNEKLQDEYRRLLEGKEVGEAQEPSDPALATGEVMATWATSLDVTADEMAGGFERAQQIANELGDSRDLDDAFAGLGNEVQRLYYQVLAQPHRRLELIDELSDEAFEEMLWFWDEAMSDAERAPIERVLGIVP